MKLLISAAILVAIFSQTTDAASCMVDGEVFEYCSNDLDGAWSFENGHVCITEAECKSLAPPNGPIVVTTMPPATTKAPTTGGPTSCVFDGETFPVCKSSDIWSFEDGGVCIGLKDCPSTSPPSSGPTECEFNGEMFPICKNTPEAWGFENGICINKSTCPTGPTSPPATTPSGPSSCSFGGETFPVCKTTSDAWGFENGGVCIGLISCENTTSPPVTTTRTPTPPVTTTRTPTPPVTTTRTPTPPTPPSGSAALYAQCGGIGYSGPTTCVAGALCNRQNEYYSQCVPDGSNTGNSGAAALWAQCGGNGYSGPTTCVSGARCNRQSEYYSQCIPA